MDVARGKKSSMMSRRLFLKGVEQALPAYRGWMNHHVGIGNKTVDDVARLPCAGVCIYGHVDHHRSADEIFARNTTPEAAVVRISSVVAHRKITIVRHAVREDDIDSTALKVSRRRWFGRAARVILFELLSIDPNIPVTQIHNVAWHADGTLYQVGLIGRVRRPENYDLLAFGIAPQRNMPVGEGQASIVSDTADDQ